MSLTFGSLFAGIGGFDLGFERAGMRPVWNCEIDEKCRRVLAKHWPGIPRFKDVKTVTGSGLGAAGLRPDVICGGFPCQDVSVAGARAGLGGERSSLFFEFARILDEAKPTWCVIENVPGLLSSQRGRDMGTVLGVLADIGYVGAYRVLDAQFYGVAQRRRRVFIVGCLGDRYRAAAVLLEPESVRRDSPPRRAEGQEVAGTLGSGAARTSTPGGGGLRNELDAMTYIPVAGTLGGGSGSRGWCDDTDRATFVTAFRKARKIHGPEATAPDEERWEETDRTDTLTERDGTAPTTAIVQSAYGLSENQRAEVRLTEEYSRQITTGGGKPGQGYPATFIPAQLAVRRLTPLECCRLQGFPDGWLDGLGLADSHKYRMLGNAVAVPVVEWLGRRLLELGHVDRLDQRGVGEDGRHLLLDQGAGSFGVGGLDGDVDVEVDEDGHGVAVRCHAPEDDKPAREVNGRYRA